MVAVSVIVVSWNTRELLRQCLRSVHSSSGVIDLEVLVVDNGSTDGSAEMIDSLFPETKLIPSPTNLGFAAANNLAIARARGEYLLLLNPDTELVGAALPRLLEFAEANPIAAVVGPQLLNPDGTVQSSRRRFPTRPTAFLESTVLQRLVPNHPILRRYYLLDRSDDEPQAVDWLVGACLLVMSSAAREIGPMDEDYFMYSEEMDWCRRFAARGWQTMYCPAAKVVHHGGQSSDQDLYHRHVHFQRSKALYFERYHGKVFALLLRCFILASYLYMLAEDVAKLPFPRRRSMRRQRIAVLARVLAWQFGWVAAGGKVRVGSRDGALGSRKARKGAKDTKGHGGG